MTNEGGHDQHGSKGFGGRTGRWSKARKAHGELKIKVRMGISPNGKIRSGRLRSTMHTTYVPAPLQWSSSPEAAGTRPNERQRQSRCGYDIVVRTAQVTHRLPEHLRYRARVETRWERPDQVTAANHGPDSHRVLRLCDLEKRWCCTTVHDTGVCSTVPHHCVVSEPRVLQRSPASSGPFLVS